MKQKLHSSNKLSASKYQQQYLGCVEYITGMLVFVKIYKILK
jgi:hypothetical protein